MRDLLQEKDRTREAVSQIVSWCLVIALHQTEGIGKKRQDDVAAKALVIQEAAAKRLARQSREEVIAWLRSKLDRLDLPDGALTFRVPFYGGHPKVAVSRSCASPGIRPPLLPG